MAIHSLIVHSITRYQEGEASSLKLLDAEQQVTADHEALFSQLKKVFNSKPGKYYGCFNPDYAQFPLQSWLREKLENKLSLLTLSQHFMRDFASQLDQSSELFEGFFVFIEEDRADGRRFYIMVLDSQRGLMFDQKLALDGIEYLNLSRLDYALRVDLDDWLSENTPPLAEQNAAASPYLCLVKGRGNAQISDFFLRSCAFQANVDSQKETEALMDILSKYTHDDSPQQARETRKKAYDFCLEQQQVGEPVPLQELSGYLDEHEPTRFSEFAKQQDELANKTALRPDTRKLKHLVRFSGKGNGISLSFSSDLVQNTILYDQDNDALTITTIPKSLKQQILRHLKEQNEET